MGKLLLVSNKKLTSRQLSLIACVPNSNKSTMSVKESVIKNIEDNCKFPKDGSYYVYPTYHGLTNSNDLDTVLRLIGKDIQIGFEEDGLHFRYIGKEIITLNNLKQIWNKYMNEPDEYTVTIRRI